MKEIEVKILEINRAEVETKLGKIGAKKVFDGVVESWIFDFEDGSLKASKSFLRLRKQGEETYLTFKKRISDEDAKIDDEHEVRVSDLEIMREIIDSLGFKELDYYKKKRTSYILDDVHFELEKLEGKYSFIPEFLEIEAPGVKVLYECVEKLGFKKEDCKSWGGRKLIRHYKNG